MKKNIVLLFGLLLIIAGMYGGYVYIQTDTVAIISDQDISPVDITSDEFANDEREDETVTEPAVHPSPATPPNIVVTPPASKTCYVGGCSGQLCTDNQDMVSTCEWREEYACYQTATCAVQADGECGWTPTTELNACLATAAE